MLWLGKISEGITRPYNEDKDCNLPPQKQSTWLNIKVFWLLLTEISLLHQHWFGEDEVLTPKIQQQTQQATRRASSARRLMIYNQIISIFHLPMEDLIVNN